MSKKDEFYKQCSFKSGNKHTTAWIPERGAKVGLTMTFEGDGPERWTVISVGSTRITKAAANKGARSGKTFIDGPQEMRRRRK